MTKRSAKDMAIFAMLGTLMYVSKFLMEFLPNIHLVGVITVAVTVVYRQKALYPIYIFVLLNGLMGGFSTWWIPYLYIWTVLWGAVMLLPQNLPTKIRPLIYMVICAAHGLCFGILYAPIQALFFHLDWRGTLAWIAAGLPFDIIHGVSNFIGGLLICPLIRLLKNADKYAADY